MIIEWVRLWLGHITEYFSLDTTHTWPATTNCHPSPTCMLYIPSKFLSQLLLKILVRLNLLNHVLSLFHAKFSCNSAIRYPVFRWESYKGCVWESVKNSSVCAFKSILVTGAREWLTTDDSPKCHMCEACRKLKGHDSWSTAGQKGQSDQLVTSWLELATCPSREWVTKTPCFAEKWLFTFLTYPTINTLIPTKCRELPERILREKQDWLIHNLRHLILQIPLLSPSPLSYPWDDTYPNPYLTIPILVRRLFGAWEAVQRGLIHLVDTMGLLRDLES